MCIVETWLCVDISDNEVVLSGYQIVRYDRSRHGGGVLMLISDTCEYTVLESGPLGLELILLNIQTKASKFLVGVFLPAT